MVAAARVPAWRRSVLLLLGASLRALRERHGASLEAHGHAEQTGGVVEAVGQPVHHGLDAEPLLAGGVDGGGVLAGGVDGGGVLGRLARLLGSKRGGLGAD